MKKNHLGIYGLACCVLGFTTAALVKQPPQPSLNYESGTKRVVHPKVSTSDQSKSRSDLLAAAQLSASALATACDEATVEEIRDAVEQIKGWPNGDLHKSTALEITSRYWAESNATESLNAALEGHSDDQLRGAFAGMSKCDPAQVHQWLEKLRKDTLFPAAVCGVSRSHPLIAGRIITGDMSSNLDSVRVEVYSSWAIAAPEDALEAGRKVQDQGTRDSILRAVYKMWGATQPKSFLLHASSLTDQDQRKFSSQGLIAAMRHAPREAMQIHLKHCPPPEYPSFEVAAEWAKYDFESGLELANSFQSHTRWVLMTALIKASPISRSLELVEQAPDSTSKIYLKQALIRNWIIAEPLAAVEWIRKQPSADQYQLTFEILDEVRKGALSQLAEIIQTTNQPPDRVARMINEWKAEEPAAAEQWLNEQSTKLQSEVAAQLAKLPPTEGSTKPPKIIPVKEALAAIMKEYPTIDQISALRRCLETQNRDVDGLLELIQTLSEQDKKRLAANWYNGFGSRDPAQSAKLYSAIAPYLSEQDAKIYLRQGGSANLELGLIIKNFSPTESRTWVDEMKPSEAAHHTKMFVFKDQFSKNPSEATTWLRSWPASNSRDEAAALVVSDVAMEDPEAATAWIGTISNDSNRDATLAEIIKRCGKIHPDAAAVWLEKIKAPNLKETLKNRAR